MIPIQNARKQTVNVNQNKPTGIMIAPACPILRLPEMKVSMRNQKIRTAYIYKISGDGCICKKKTLLTSQEYIACLSVA
jgi:hypothetical protein